MVQSRLLSNTTTTSSSNIISNNNNNNSMLFRLQQQRTNISTQQQDYKSVLRLERTSPGDLQLPPRPPRRSSSSGSPSLMASPETVRRPEQQTADLLRPQEICQRLQRLSASELGNNSRQVYYHSEVQKSSSTRVNGQPKRVLEECRRDGDKEPERPLLVPHPRAVAVRPFRSVGGPQPLGNFGGESLGKMRPLELSLRPLTANIEDVHPNAGQRTEMRLFVQGELIKTSKPQFCAILFSGSDIYGCLCGANLNVDDFFMVEDHLVDYVNSMHKLGLSIV